MKSLMLRFTSGVTSPCVTVSGMNSKHPPFSGRSKSFQSLYVFLKQERLKKIEHPSEKHGTKRKL